MSRSEREALEARKTALRAQLQRRREAARAELQRRRAHLPQPRQDRRRWPWVLVLIAALLLLFSDCTCSSPPTPEEPSPEPPATEKAPEFVAPSQPPRDAPRGRMPRLDRPEYTSEVPEVLPWVAAFQAQVEARSPRLSACFEGAVRPGRLKWTAAVEPGSGRVSEHTLEPTVADEALTRTQRTCVLDVLSSPPYRLDDSAERATPSRVGIVIEF